MEIPADLKSNILVTPSFPVLDRLSAHLLQTTFKQMYEVSIGYNSQQSFTTALKNQINDLGFEKLNRELQQLRRGWLFLYSIIGFRRKTVRELKATLKLELDHVDRIMKVGCKGLPRKVLLESETAFHVELTRLQSNTF